MDMFMSALKEMGKNNILEKDGSVLLQLIFCYKYLLLQIVPSATR